MLEKTLRKIQQEYFAWITNIPRYFKLIIIPIVVNWFGRKFPIRPLNITRFPLKNQREGRERERARIGMTQEMSKAFVVAELQNELT